MKISTLVSSFIRKRQPLHSGYLMLFVIAICSSMILFGTRDSIFNIKGVTQVISIATTSSQANQWVLDDGVLFAPYAPIESLDLDGANFLEVHGNVVVSITSLNTQELDKLVISVKKEDGPVATLHTPSGAILLSDYIDITVTHPNEKIFAFEGVASIGEDIGDGVETILLEGELSILERQFFSSRRYQGDNFILNMGDRVVVNGNILSKGFVRHSHATGLYFSVIADGDSARIVRFGSNDLTISSSVWNRLTRDPIIAAITSLLAFSFLLLEFVTLLKATLERKHR